MLAFDIHFWLEKIEIITKGNCAGRIYDLQCKMIHHAICLRSTKMKNVNISAGKKIDKGGGEAKSAKF